MENIFKFLILFVLIFLIDAIWILLVINKQYRIVLGKKMRNNISSFWGFSLFTYLVLTLCFFIFLTPLLSESLGSILWHGAFLGFVIYSVFALTNFVVIRFWTFKLAFLDSVWGAVLGTFAGAILWGIDKIFKASL